MALSTCWEGSTELQRNTQFSRVHHVIKFHMTFHLICERYAPFEYTLSNMGSRKDSDRKMVRHLHAPAIQNSKRKLNEWSIAYWSIEWRYTHVHINVARLLVSLARIWLVLWTFGHQMRFAVILRFFLISTRCVNIVFHSFFLQEKNGSQHWVSRIAERNIFSQISASDTSNYIDKLLCRPLVMRIRFRE